MKATITFNLPEDQEEYQRANKAPDLCSLVWDFEQHLRGLYRTDLGDMTAMDLMEKLYGENGKWWELKEDNRINFEEIWN
jgi:hypothetical protein